MSRRALTTVVIAGALGGLLLGCSNWRTVRLYHAARLYQTGTASLDAGHVERAMSQLERAARLQPEASEIHNHLGLAPLAAGDRDGARIAFEQALELDCENVAARRNLAALEQP